MIRCEKNYLPGTNSAGQDQTGYRYQKATLKKLMVE